jgi:hypothetical protein
MLRLGIPEPALSSMISTIQEMEHHVCTGFGISEATYGDCPDKPPAQGVLQGNGTGPTEWFTISLVMIEILRAAGFEYKEWTVIRNRAINIACLAFFDNTDIVHSNQDPFVTSEDLIDEAERALYLWNGLLGATGGALAPKKGYWYVVEMVRRHGRWQHALSEDAPGLMYLPGSANPIERRPVHQKPLKLSVCKYVLLAMKRTKPSISFPGLKNGANPFAPAASSL